MQLLKDRLLELWNGLDAAARTKYVKMETEDKAR